VDEPKALAQAITRIINHPEEAAALAESARGKVRAYTPERIARQWNRIVDTNPK
jgi:glycosyltransferase involved in cell wall biosynthesis